MAKNNTNVNVYADGNYAVWTGVLGTATPVTLPPTNPGAGYYECGLLSSAGITEAHTFSENKIYDMAGSLVRIARTQEERPFTFVALEGNNVVNSLRYPGSSVTTTSTANVQTITIAGTGTAGTFSLTLPEFAQASGLAYNISAAALAAALTSATGLTVGVTGTPGTSYIVTFPATAGALGLMTAVSNITGATSITVANTTPGTTGINTRAVGPGTGRNLRQFVLDKVDGDVHERILINNGEAVWTGTTVYSGANAAEYTFTLQPYKDANGNFYTIIDDNEANAEAFV